MNENRLQVLQMLSEGKITADEADRLIAAMEKEQPAANPKAKAKYVRVVVVDNGKGTGPTVNVRVPMQLLRAGVKLTSLLPPQVREHVNDAFRRDGVPFDLNQIKPENLEELIDQLDELTVDVDDKDVKVKIFCE